MLNHTQTNKQNQTNKKKNNKKNNRGTVLRANHPFPGRGIRDNEIANKRNKMLLTILVVIPKRKRKR